MMGNSEWAREHLAEQQATPEQTQTLCQELHKRIGEDHGYLMIYGSNVESQPVRYFYLLHAVETLVIARHAPHILTHDEVRTLRRVSVPYNWDFAAWHARMCDVHNNHREDLGDAVAASIREFTTRTPIQAPFRDKKMREDVLFFTMLTFIEDLFRHWMSGAPNAPRVLDPPSFETFMLYDQPHCHSVKSIIALMLYGRTRGQYDRDTLAMMRDGGARYMRSDPFEIPHTPCKQAVEEEHVTAHDPSFESVAESASAVHSTQRESRHATQENSGSAFETLFGSENPHTHIARLLKNQRVDMEQVVYHISSNYTQEVCCFESTANVVRQKRAAEERQRQMERERLVHSKCRALE